MKQIVNQNGGSRTDTLIKLVLVFFLSLLSFSVGTFVGKQFSDSQHRVADLEEDSDRVVASVPTDLNKSKDNQVISEEEISKLSDEFVKKEKDDTTKIQNAVPTANKKETSGTDKKTDVGALVKDSKKMTVHDEISEVSKKIAEGIKVEAPKVAPRVTRVPTSLPKDLAASAIGKFTVQLSSLPTEGDAKNKAQDYRDKGYSAFYVPALVNGKTWYRVNVGQFETAKEAKEYRTQLAKDSTFASAIVQKISP